MVKKRKTLAENNKNIANKSIDIILKYVFSAILFIAPLFRGLFFEPEFFIAAALIGILGIIYIMTIKKLRFDLPDWLFLGLVFSYILSMTNAASLRLSYLGVLKSVTFFICFYIARNAFTEEKDREHLIITIVSGVSFITVLTILTKVNLLSIRDLLIGDRFAGTFQYANTYAAVLAATSITLLGLAYNTGLQQNGKARSIFISLAYLNLLALFATGSRGGILIYGFALILFILMSDKKLCMLVNSFFITALSLAGAALLYFTVNSLLVFAAVIAGLLAVLLVDKLSGKLTAKSMLVALGAVIAAGFVILSTTSGSPLQRLADISFSSSGFFVRYIFYKDALKIFSQNWFIGTGSGGWETLYTTVQTFPYMSRLVHSSAVQSLVDVGIIGTLFFLSLCGFMIIKCLRNKFAFSPVNGCAFLSFITLFLHSLIDFDLSIPVVAFFMFILLGLLYGRSSPGKHQGIGKSVVLVLLGITLLSSVSFALADSIANSAVVNASTGGASIDSVKKDFKTAVVLDPMNAFYRNYLAQTIITLGIDNNNDDEIEEGLAVLNKAISLESNSYIFCYAKGQALVQLKRYTEAIEEYEKVVEIRPFHDTGYAAIVKTYVLEGQHTKDIEAFKKAIPVYDEAIERLRSVPEIYQKYITNDANLEKSPELNFYTGLSYMFLGEYQKAEPLLAIAEKYGREHSLSEDIKAWRVVCSNKMNKVLKLDADAVKIAQIEDILNEFNNRAE